MFDPEEGDNVATDPANAGVLADLRERLDAWMGDRNDPLLDGPIEPPPGAILNDPTQISPDEPTHLVDVRADPTAAPSS